SLTNPLGCSVARHEPTLPKAGIVATYSGERMTGELSGKVVIVTGASRGIGEAIARRFAADGARVAVSARTVNEGDHRLLSGSLRGTVPAIADAGGSALAVPANLALADDRARLVETVERELGPIDVL